MRKLEDALNYSQDPEVVLRHLESFPPEDISKDANCLLKAWFREYPKDYSEQQEKIESLEKENEDLENELYEAKQELQEKKDAD